MTALERWRDDYKRRKILREGTQMMRFDWQLYCEYCGELVAYGNGDLEGCRFMCPKCEREGRE